MSIVINDPYDYGMGIFADSCDVSERPTHSKLLGPDGNALPYRQPEPVGFDLRMRKMVPRETKA